MTIGTMMATMKIMATMDQKTMDKPLTQQQLKWITMPATLRTLVPQFNVAL